MRGRAAFFFAESFRDFGQKGPEDTVASSKQLGKSKDAKIGKNANTTGGDVEARKAAAELRLRGYSFKAIGEKLGVSPNRAYDYVREALEEQRKSYQETAGEALQQELNRIERNITLLEKIVFPPDKVAEDEIDESTGKPIPVKLTKTQADALFQMNMLLDRKARLLGFYKTDDTKTKEPLPWSDDE